jgi:hypothetical protein
MENKGEIIYQVELIIIDCDVAVTENGYRRRLEWSTLHGLLLQILCP